MYTYHFNLSELCMELEISSYLTSEIRQLAFVKEYTPI